MIALRVKNAAKSLVVYRETPGMQIGGKPGEVTLAQAGGNVLALNEPPARAASLT